jgi:hypothetical protein
MRRRPATVTPANFLRGRGRSRPIGRYRVGQGDPLLDIANAQGGRVIMNGRMFTIEDLMSGKAMTRRVIKDWVHE